MRARIGNVHQALMWACCLSGFVNAYDPMNSTLWREVTPDPVVTSHGTSSVAAMGYLGTKRARSRVECVLECHRHPDCVSVAFDPTSGDCYLQPDLSNDQTQPAHLGQVWVKEDSICHTADAPISNGVVDWEPTLTPLRGAVRCNEESMKTADDVSVTCMAGGSWLKEGECVRHIWTNPPLSIFPLDVPFPVIDGWTACVEGIPTQDTKFIVNLNMADPNNLALHAVFLINDSGYTNTIATDNLLNGRWGDGQGGLRTRLVPFPVSVGTPFRIKVKAASSSTIEMYVDDILIVTRSQPIGLLASDVTGVQVLGDVSVTRVNLWFHN